MLLTNSHQTVTVWLNRGDGTFLAGVDYPVSSDENAMLSPALTADVNRDGRLDIVASDTTHSIVRTLYGRGNGTFEASVELVRRSDPLIATSDFNRDGVLDLVTAQFPTLTVTLGGTSGSFAQPTNYEVGSEGNSTQLFATGDVNGDGNSDLVVLGGQPNGSTRDLWVLLGRGNGSFAAASPTFLPVGERPLVLELKDVNGDGRDDLLTDRSDTRIVVFTADANGALQLHAEYDISDNVRDVSIADYTGDGVVDLALPSPAQSGVTVLVGHGDGTFGSETEYGQSGRPGGLAAGDINGDGSADFVTANPSGHTVSVRLGNGQGGFASSREYSVGSHPDAVALGDFNRDSVLDLVVSHRDPAINNPTLFLSVSVAFGIGDGSFGTPTEWFVSGVPVAVTAVDVNGDGLDDIVTANARSVPLHDAISVLLSNGDRTFTELGSYRTGSADPSDLATGDVNRDGLLDVVTVTGTDSSGTVSLLLGRGDGAFHSPIYSAVGRGSRAVTVGDLNGDGNPDVITGNAPSYLQPGASVSVLLGKGDGTWEPRADYAVAEAPERIALADMNADNKLDVVWSNGSYGTFSIWLGTGDGTLSTAGSASFAAGNSAQLTSFGIADFDQDGKLDVSLADADRAGVVVALQAGDSLRPGPRPTPTAPLPDDNAPGLVGARPATLSYTGSAVSGTLTSNTVWSGLMVVRGPLTVAAGAKLVIQPGTTIKFADLVTPYYSEPGRLDVYGALEVGGTAANPVIFTSLADDSAGGDTNADGASSVAHAGDWGAIRLHASAPASSISYAQVRYGGSWYNEAVLVDGGSPTFNNVMIRDAQSRGLAISGTAGGSYSSIDVERTGGTGIAASGTLATSLKDIRIAHTGRALGGGGWGNDGISVFGATTSLQSVQISHVPGWAIDMPMSAWPYVTGLAIDATTSGHDGAVHLSGTLTAACTPQTDVTWNVEGLIDAGAQLTLLPGTVLKGSLIVVGTLDARGTAERPIVITGIGDDSVGGDTNDDNNASHARESIGPRLRFFDTTSSGSVLDYVEVRYGGGRNGSGTPQAAVEIENASPRLSHVTIRDTDNWALLLKQDAGPTIEHLTVENCLGNGPSDGFGVYAQSDAGTFLLSDVSFRRVTNWPLYLADIDQWGRVTNVQVDATSCVRGASVYVAGGTLASDVRPAAGLAWQTDQITVPAGRTLTLDPATILKSTEPLNVFGVLYCARDARRTGHLDGSDR